MTTSIKVRHNIEVAHRLFNTPGKCENIHGHSMYVTLELFGNVDSSGKLNGLEFGAIKALLRAYLDENFDHRFLVNVKDKKMRHLPGVNVLTFDPTTENLAAFIGRWAEQAFDVGRIRCEVQETAVNAATWEIP